MKRLIFQLVGLAILSVMFSTAAAAQDGAAGAQGTPLSQEELKALEKKVEGTYQVQVKNARVKPSIPADLAQIVEKNRHATKTTYVSLGTLVRVKILPSSEISKAGFKGLEKIKYVSEEEFKAE